MKFKWEDVRAVEEYKSLQTGCAPFSCEANNTGFHPLFPTTEHAALS